MRVNHPNLAEMVLRRGSYFLAEQLMENYKKNVDKAKAMNVTFRNETLKDKKAYGRIINLLPDETSTASADKVVINSIDSIKGQEGISCFFVLTTDMAAYLFGDKTGEKTTKNRLYVALTRSLNKLSIFVTTEVETKYGRDFILDFFDEYL